MADKIDDKIIRYKNESNDFKDSVLIYFTKKNNKEFTHKGIEVLDLKRNFDLVSEDNSCVGEIKYYHNEGNLNYKFSSICEYVWILENIDIKNKFIVFGGNKKVPSLWISKYKSLVKNVKMYFFDGIRLEELL